MEPAPVHGARAVGGQDAARGGAHAAHVEEDGLRELERERLALGVDEHALHARLERVRRAPVRLARLHLRRVLELQLAAPAEHVARRSARKHAHVAQVGATCTTCKTSNSY